MLITRTVRAVLALGISLALLVAMSVVAPPAVSAGTADDEHQFAQLINQVRANAGLPALAVHAELTSGARSWAQSMATSDQLAHSPNMAEGLSAQWTVLGENVGVHGVQDLQQLFDAFVASPSHYQNIVDPRFQYVGIGVVHTDAGKLWTTHRFMATNTPIVAPTTTPPTTAPPTTAVPTTLPPTTPAPTSPPTTPPPTTQTTAPTTTTRPATVPPTTAGPASTGAPNATPSTPATSPSTTAPGTISPGAPESSPTSLNDGTDGVGGVDTDGQPLLDQADMAELVQPDVSTIEEVLIDLVEAGI